MEAPKKKCFVVMGFGIAIMQPALPTLVREWVPQRVALGIA